MKEIIILFGIMVLEIKGCTKNQKAAFNYKKEKQTEKSSSNPFDYTQNEY